MSEQELLKLLCCNSKLGIEASGSSSLCLTNANNAFIFLFGVHYTEFLCIGNHFLKELIISGLTAMAVLMSKYKLEKKCMWQTSNKHSEIEVYYSFLN